MLYCKIRMKKIKGVTIVELIFGIIIIAIISVAAFEFFRYCRRFIVESEIRLGAVNFARETMERHSWNIQHSWNDGKTIAENWQPDSLPTGVAFASGIRDDYAGGREYSVQLNASGSANTYNIIKVRVNWTY